MPNMSSSRYASLNSIAGSRRRILWMPACQYQAFARRRLLLKSEQGPGEVCLQLLRAPAIPFHRPNDSLYFSVLVSTLLLSCADCNRPRTQDNCDGNARVIGKANFFPLADETKRASGSWLVLRGEPLLLNPCIDDPADHLVFLEDGRLGPCLTDGEPSPKGKASIYYLELARAELLQMLAWRARRDSTMRPLCRLILISLFLASGGCFAWFVFLQLKILVPILT